MDGGACTGILESVTEPAWVETTGVLERDTEAARALVLELENALDGTETVHMAEWLELE